MKRPDWNEYFMSIAILISQRSTCIRRKVGAVIVKDKRILSTGYNGVPTGIKHCSETGCLREKLQIPSGKMHELCRGLHAEQNAIIQAALHGVAIKGADLYCTNQPCIICTKMIINSGIKNVYFKDPYQDELSLEMLKETDISLIHLSSNES